MKQASSSLKLRRLLQQSHAAARCGRACRAGRRSCRARRARAETRCAGSLPAGLAHGLLDHARAGKADQRARLGDIEIAEHRQAGRYAAHGRIGHHRNERQARLGPAARAPRWSSPSASASSSASCMRAPPLAEKHTRPQRCSMQCSTARLNRSPTTEPIEPPRNRNSNAQATTVSSPCSCPASTTSASLSPVASAPATRRSL